MENARLLLRLRQINHPRRLRRRIGVALDDFCNPQNPPFGLDPDAEAAVKAITDQILAQMK